MKGPGIRIDNDTRRAWRCPVCNQTQAVALDVTLARCDCTREGVPMKLAEGLRPDRRALRPEVRAILNRIQAGEQFPRLTSLGPTDSEMPTSEGAGGRSQEPRPDRRPPRRDRSEGSSRLQRGSDNRPRREQPPLDKTQPVDESAPSEPAPMARPKTPDSEDTFGAGIENTQ